MCVLCDRNNAYAAQWPARMPPIEIWWRWSFRPAARRPFTLGGSP